MEEDIFVCPITEQKVTYTSIQNGDSITRAIAFQTRYYPIRVDKGIDKYICLCSSFFHAVLHNTFEFISELNELRPYLVYEWLNDGLKSLGGDVIHWDCKDAVDKPDQLVLSGIKNSILSNSTYPLTRKQKGDNLLLYISDQQSQDGEYVKLRPYLAFFGNLYFRNYRELLFYVEEYSKKGLLVFDDASKMVKPSLDGHEYIEKLSNKAIPNSVQTHDQVKYDVGLSFAGEDRDLAEEVAEHLKLKNIRVFYDAFEKADLWGKDLYQQLNEVYRDKCTVCILFVSKNYANKLWTKHELKAAQAREFREFQEYILPVRIDNTELPGMNNTIGYINASDHSPSQIADLTVKKLEKLSSNLI